MPLRPRGKKASPKWLHDRSLSKQYKDNPNLIYTRDENGKQLRPWWHAGTPWGRTFTIKGRGTPTALYKEYIKKIKRENGIHRNQPIPKEIHVMKHEEYTEMYYHIVEDFMSLVNQWYKVHFGSTMNLEIAAVPLRQDIRDSFATIPDDHPDTVLVYKAKISSAAHVSLNWSNTKHAPAWREMITKRSNIRNKKIDWDIDDFTKDEIIKASKWLYVPWIEIDWEKQNNFNIDIDIL